MRTPGWKRWTAAFLAALFLGAGAADVYGFHECPHHDSMDIGPEAAHAAAGTSAPAAAVDRPADADDDGEEHSHDFCTCVDTCHAGAASPVPSVGAVTPTPDSIGTVVFHGIRTHAPRAALSPYLLPFANAPPLPSLAA